MIDASVLMIQRRAAGVPSGDDIVDHLAVYVGQAVVASTVAVGQLLMVESHEMEDRCMEVMDMDPVLYCGQAEIVSRPVAEAGFHSTPGHEHREAVGVVIPTGALAVLSRWLATELTAPDDQGLIEHPALLEILDQSRDGLVGIAGMNAVVAFEAAVGIPVIIVMRPTGVDLDKANAALDKPPGQQALPTEVISSRPIDALEITGRIGLLVEINRLGRVLLHVEGKLIARNPRGQV